MGLGGYGMRDQVVGCQLLGMDVPSLWSPLGLQHMKKILCRDLIV